MKTAPTSLFSQVISLIDRPSFERHAAKLKAEAHAKGFNCWTQMVAMLFCQIGQAKSLREIVHGLSSCLGKLQHLGCAEAPKRSTLAYANAHRNWELYRLVFFDVLARCQQIAPKKKFRFKNKLLSLDASVIDLCASLFDWAKFRRTKGAVKLHLLLDHDGCLPTFACITEGKTHEINVAHQLDLPKGAIVAIDRGYFDFFLFAKWTRQEVSFVTRIKENTAYRIVEERPLPSGSRLVADYLIEMTGTRATEANLGQLRLVLFDDPAQGRLEFLTNNFSLAASTIAEIYRQRWQVELFFKAIKQNLRVKTFVGTSANALRIQIWTALIAILLLKYLQFLSQSGWALSNLVSLLRWNLFIHRDLQDFLDKPDECPTAPPTDQLKLAFA